MNKKLNFYVILDSHVPTMTFPEDTDTVIVHDFTFTDDVKYIPDDCVRAITDQIVEQKAYDRVYIGCTMPSGNCKHRVDCREIIENISAIHKAGGDILGWSPDISHRQGVIATTFLKPRG